MCGIKTKNKKILGEKSCAKQSEAGKFLNY